MSLFTIGALNKIENFEPFFKASVPGGVINVNNNAVVYVIGLWFVSVPPIVIVVVIIYVHTAHKVAHFIAGIYIDLIHIITINLYFL